MNQIKKYMSKYSWSFLWFFIGSISLFFSNGRWSIPLSIWIVTICFLRFVRIQGIITGFVSVLLISFLSNIFIWKGILPLPSPLYFIVCFISAIFFAIPFLIEKTFQGKLGVISSTIIYPCSFVLFSYLYYLINPSGTFGSIAYSQSEITLLQIVSITGIWGIIFLIGWTASIIVHVMEKFNQLKKLKSALLLYLVVLVCVILYGEVKMHVLNIQRGTVRVAGIIHDFEFNKSVKDNIIEFKNYARTTEKEIFNDSKKCARAGAKIIFWQETALLIFKEDEDSLLSRAKEFAEQQKIFLGISLLSITHSFPNEPGENKILWFTPDGKESFHYLKAYPTPSENIISGDKVIKTMETDWARLSSAICFDLDFPSYVSKFAKMKINLLTVPANDWREITPYHASIALFRAIENGFSVVRVTGKGLSVAYDSNGKQIASSNYFTNQNRSFIAEVPIGNNVAVYPYAVDFLPVMCFFGMLLLIISVIKLKIKLFQSE
jgi:apolipoprotein N-acyltransferase